MTAVPFSAVYFDGRFIPPPADEAHVSIMDPGYLLGEGVFATMRGYDGVCFRAERHLANLARGAEAFGLALPVGIDRLIAIADEAAARTRSSDAYVRATLTRSRDEARPVLSVLARTLDTPADEDYARGVDATIVTARRVPPACIDATMKSTSYAPQVLARREVAARGAAEGIMLAVDGSLACGTMGNLFLVAGGELLTPSFASGCRAGITREAVIEVAASIGLRVREERLEQAALWAADEAFLTSSRVECLAIANVDGRAIGSATGSGRERHSFTTTLRAALRALVRVETTMAAASVRRGTA